MTVEDKQELIALGRVIRVVRDERSMDPDELAAVAGIERGQLDAIEAGKSDPPYDVLLALAHGLGVEPAVLVSRAGSTDTGSKGSPFGRRLRKLRREHGVSQDRLAHITGFHRTTISKLELGERDPQLGTILRLAQAIGVPPEAFVQGLDVTEDEPLARFRERAPQPARPLDLPPPTVFWRVEGAELGVVIRARRHTRGQSIEALAGEAGMHSTYLGVIERGRGNPTWDKLSDLAEALEVSVSTLAREAEDHRIRQTVRSR